MQGKPTTLTSLVVPIIVGDQFYGISGVDLTLAFLQEKANDVEDLYEGTAQILIISNNGTLAAVTGKPELAGKHMKEVHEDWEEDIQYIQSGKKMVESDEGRLAAFVPLKLGLTTTPWSVNVLIPMDKITEKADTLMAAAAKDMWIMIVIRHRLLGGCHDFPLVCGRWHRQTHTDDSRCLERYCGGRGRSHHSA